MKTISHEEYQGAVEAGFRSPYLNLICEGETARHTMSGWVADTKDDTQGFHRDAQHHLDRLWDFIGSMAD